MTVAALVPPASVRRPSLLQPGVVHPGQPDAGIAPDTGIRRALGMGLWALAVLFGVLGLWSAFTLIGGAVIAQGQIMVRGKPQLVQSLEGGRVTALHVRNGELVRRDQVLVALDPSGVATALNIARSRLADALALRARLVAEQHGQAVPDFTPPALPFAPPDLAAQARVQRQIFIARAAVLAGQKTRAAEAQVQYTAQIASLGDQIAAKRDEIALVEAEIDAQQALLNQGLARRGPLSDLRRNQAALLGALAALTGEEARLRNALRDIELERLQAERSRHEEVVTALQETTARIEELTLEIVMRSAERDRLDIRAPVEGIVHELQVTTQGGVLAQGGAVLTLIPLEQGVEFELSVDPRAIDQVSIGQKAEVTISSFDPRSVPRLHGQVVSVSPDAVSDPRTGRSFYRVGVNVAAGELARLGDLVPVPGMPVEAYLATGDRSVLSYLLHPLTANLGRAFREG